MWRCLVLSGKPHSYSLFLPSLNETGQCPTIPTLARARPIRAPAIGWNLKRASTRLGCIMMTQVWNSGSELGDDKIGLGQDKKGQ